MTNETIRTSRDWVASARTNILAWWVPHAAMLATLFVAVPARTTVWTIAVAWMGIACVLNARQCCRTHCRYTGPYYLAMIVPVMAMGFMSAGAFAWIALGTVIVGGAKLIWFATERVWGKFS